MKQKEQQLSNELVKQELQTLIDNIDERNENLLSAARNGKSIEQQNNIRLRSTPYLSLQRRGLITVDYLIAEFDRIQERTTRHSSAERKCIVNLVLTAVHNAAVKQAKQQESNDNKKDTEHDTE